MQRILSPFWQAIKHLSVVQSLPSMFDANERRQVVQAIVIGAVVWAIVFALKTSVHWAFHELVHWLDHAPVWWMFGPLIVGAMITTFFVHWRSSTVHYRADDDHIHELNDVEGDGLERAIALYYAAEPKFEQTLLGKEGVDVRWELPTFSLAIRKFLATLATLGSGGSGGLEASVTLIGESVAAGLFKPRAWVPNAVQNRTLFQRVAGWWQNSEPDELQTAQLSGIAAAVSTLLGAPFAAAFFATEVMYRRRPIIEKLVFSLVAALVAFFLSSIFSGGHTAIFEVDNLIDPPNTPQYYGAVVIVAILISLVSLYFSRVQVSFDNAFHKAQPNVWLRHITGAVVTGVIAIIAIYLTDAGPALVLGPGEEPILAAMAGELTLTVAVVALFAKMLATLATIGSGGSAGLLVPSLYFGTMVATIVAVLFGLPPVILIIPAMAGALVSIVNVPLAAMLFVAEVFGANYMVPSLVTLIFGLLFAQRTSIYRTQRETYTGKQILPGYATKRIEIPSAWIGKSLLDLDIRHKYGISVIGLVATEAAQEQVQLNPAPTYQFALHDVLIVMGKEADLARFSDEVQYGVEKS